MNPAIAAPPAAPHRRWRASVLAVVVVYVAVLGHLTGGGMAPDLPAVALALGLSWPVCWQLTAVRRGFPAILAALTLAQPVLHVILEFGGALLAGFAGRTAAGHHETVAVTGDVAAPVGSGTVAMLSCHAVAAVLSAVVLARGERALAGALSAGRRIAAWVVSLVGALDCAPVPTVTAIAAPDVRDLPVPQSISLPARHGRRGPPQLLGAH